MSTFSSINKQIARYVHFIFLFHYNAIIEKFICVIYKTIVPFMNVMSDVTNMKNINSSNKEN